MGFYPKRHLSKRLFTIRLYHKTLRDFSKGLLKDGMNLVSYFNGRWPRTSRVVDAQCGKWQRPLSCGRCPVWSWQGRGEGREEREGEGD